jgi:hypothetical protein
MECPVQQRHSGAHIKAGDSFFPQYPFDLIKLWNPLGQRFAVLAVDLALYPDNCHPASAGMAVCHGPKEGKNVSYAFTVGAPRVRARTQVGTRTASASTSTSPACDINTESAPSLADQKRTMDEIVAAVKRVPDNIFSFDESRRRLCIPGITADIVDDGLRMQLERQCGSVRLLYLGDVEKMIVKCMPGAVHEFGAGDLGRMLIRGVDMLDVRLWRDLITYNATRKSASSLHTRSYFSSQELVSQRTGPRRAIGRSARQHVKKWITRPS